MDESVCVPYLLRELLFSSRLKFQNSQFAAIYYAQRKKNNI